MLKKTLLAAAVFAFATTAVQANEVSGYLTGSIGQAKADKPKPVKEAQNFFKDIGGIPGLSSSTSTDRTDTAYKIAVGLKVNPYVALEAQYIDLGKSNYKGAISDQADSFSAKADLKTSGLGANLVGTLPIDDFTLFAKVGYHYLKTKGTLKLSDGIDSFSESETVRKWTPSFGAGASYNITKELAVVAEYERYKSVADKKVDGENFKHDIDLASVGLRYNF